ncbi:hypothetical protein ACDF64_04570 [Agromyces sp. MMS24-JH15]|uniref:hypothetical protein n=1 Tax=Agromyces sp. MMS24-JH15 TaxID=3243765 RepID=UPI0037492E43
MAEVHDAAPIRAGYWVVPVTRGVIALVPGAAIAFVQDHSPAVGLVVFGAWAILTGLVVGALSLRLVEDRAIRVILAVQAVVTATAGLLALTVPGGLAFLAVLLITWAAITGILEIFAGLRARGRTPAARDWLTAGILTAAYAVVVLVVPSDSVTVVGFLGGYLVVLGVALVIGGLSLKWATAAPAVDVPAAPRTEQP